MAIERIKVNRGSTYVSCLDYKGNLIRFIDKDKLHSFFNEGYLVKSDYLIFKTFQGVVYGISSTNYNHISKDRQDRWTQAHGWLKYLYEPRLYNNRGHTLLEDIDGTLHEVKEEIGDKLIKIPRLVI